MKVKRNIYLVMDYGGDEINPWDLPYMAFDDEQAAEHCVEKHKERKTLAPGEEPMCNWDLYDFSAVCTIPFLVDEQTCRNVYRGTSKNGFECSVCGDRVEDADKYDISGTFNFCPCCGRKVVTRCS